MAAARIFISYRRDDSAGFARAIGDALGQRFGRERIWLDVDDIGAGDAFDAEIERAVGSASVLLVLIGRRWLGSADESGARRLDDPEDFVRHEVTTGLVRGLHVVPLLLDGAAMPAEHDLPAELKPLARRQALPIDNARFEADLDRLQAVLRAALAGRDGRLASPRVRVALGAALVTALSAVAWWTWHVPPRPPLNGRWTADVTYDWPNARHAERFDFHGEGTALHGSASFLQTDRGLLEGRVDAEGRVAFVIRTQESLGDAPPREVTHRYSGRLAADRLDLVMQTEGGYSSHVPVEIRARRVPD